MTTTTLCVKKESKTKSRRQTGGGCQGEGESVFNGDRVSVLEDEKVLKIDGGDGRTTRLYLKLLNCTLSKRLDGKFYVVCILSQLKTSKQNKISK